MYHCYSFSAPVRLVPLTRISCSENIFMSQANAPSFPKAGKCCDIFLSKEIKFGHSATAAWQLVSV